MHILLCLLRGVLILGWNGPLLKSNVIRERQVTPVESEESLQLLN